MAENGRKIRKQTNRSMWLTTKTILIIIIIIYLKGCSRAELRPETNPVTVRVNGRPLPVRLTATREGRRLGLRLRTASYEEDVILLILYPQPEVISCDGGDFPFPVDVAFLDPSGTVVGTSTLRAYSDDTAESGVACSAVLQSPAGGLRRAGILPGAKVEIPAGVFALAAKAWKRDHEEELKERREWGLDLVRPAPE